jgi:CRP-like cAMP-binding protein
MGKAQLNALDLLVAKASEHGTILQADRAALKELRFTMRQLSPGEDVIRQGDTTDAAVFISSGTLARYHTLTNGERQYLTLHIKGDMPDVQSLFLNEMDHSLCALDRAAIALFKHDALRSVFVQRPGLAFAFWRLTLVDAAIFRQAITNNSARAPVPRLAHFFCEIFARARQAGLAVDNSCALPLTQTQLGQALGMSHISINRSLRALREAGYVDHRAGILAIHDWRALVAAGSFDPTYLHFSKDSDTARMSFPTRKG